MNPHGLYGEASRAGAATASVDADDERERGAVSQPSGMSHTLPKQRRPMQQSPSVPQVWPRRRHSDAGGGSQRPVELQRPEQHSLLVLHSDPFMRQGSAAQ